jgi:hypothetical protein
MMNEYVDEIKLSRDLVNTLVSDENVKLSENARKKLFALLAEYERQKENGVQ